jgi:hypothetical protein
VVPLLEGDGDQVAVAVILAMVALAENGGIAARMRFFLKDRLISHVRWSYIDALSSHAASRSISHSVLDLERTGETCSKITIAVRKVDIDYQGNPLS